MRAMHPDRGDQVITLTGSRQEDRERASAGDTMIEAIADVEEAAKYLGLTSHALRHKAAVEIPCVRIDSKLRFDRRDLDRYIDCAKREGI